MPKQHWLESFEVNRGCQVKEGLVWRKYVYDGWEVEAGGDTKGRWDNVEAVYKTKSMYRCIELRDSYLSLWDALEHLAVETKLVKPEDPGCEHKGTTVESYMRSVPLPKSLKKAVQSRLVLGEIKYGTKLTVGWDKALSYLEEEEDDMLAYCLSAKKPLYALLLGGLIWLRRRLHKRL
jgi:hypothetical protein